MSKKKEDPSDEIYPVALTIAGSDSGGGAGIQADLRTFNAYGVFGTSAITAITAQNPLRVAAIHPVPPEVVASQIETVLAEIQVAGVKTGMLHNAATIEAVAAAVRKHHLKPVVDPVMVSTSGAVLLEDSAIAALIAELIPAAAWITPNLPEAELLLGRKLRTHREFADGARECFDRWGCAVFLKTGHAQEGDSATDYICRNGEIFAISSPRVDVRNAAHGTGCTLSAAMAAGFALNLGWKQVVCEAKEFVLGSLIENVRIGRQIRAMYPAVEDRSDWIKLDKYQ